MAHILVTITRSKHPTQPWTFSIDKPGPQGKETKRERYTRKATAKRGALRQLGAVKYGDGVWEAAIKGKVYAVKFATIPY